MDVAIIADDAQRIGSDPKFLDWLKRVKKGGFEVVRIVVHKAIFTPRGLLFAFIEAEVSYNGKRVPGIAFIRGDAVAVLVVLVDENSREWAVLTKQPRFPAGKVEMVEALAGMVDENVGKFSGAAARELKEEAGLEISADDLISLGSIIPSAGGCDEEVALFFVRVHLPASKILELQGKVMGVDDEIVHLLIVPIDEVPDNAPTDPKALVAFYRYMKYVP